MNNGDKPATPLDESLDRYDRALRELELHANAKPVLGANTSSEPTEALKKLYFEQIVEVLVARDVVEKNRVENENPSGKSVARLIELDKRLKAQRGTLAKIEGLTEWKSSLCILSNNWWWDLTHPLLLPSPNEVIECYEKALNALSSATSIKASKEQVVDVLLARDDVESLYAQEEELPDYLRKKIRLLDEQLRAQKQKLVIEGTLEYRERSKHQKDWWWQLTNPEAELNKAIKDYKQSLEALEEQEREGLHPTSEQILKVLLARDEVEQIISGLKRKPKKKINEISELDNRLCKQAGAIAKDNQVHQWKVYYNPPEQNWWWLLITDLRLLIQCVERYDQALIDLESADSLEDQSFQALILLKTRDALEEAIKNQKSIPERMYQKIADLDQKLKQYRLVLSQGKQLINWKKSLKPPQENWWWDFKPTIFGDDDNPVPTRDRLWILGALVCIGIAAGIVMNTAQTFQSGIGKDQSDAVRSDALQNSLVILQGAGLLGLGASTATKWGQKMVEDIITNLPFLRPKWHAPATFCLSLSALVVAYGINKSLPLFGERYFNQGQALEEENQLFQAQDKYRQAKKFFTDADDRAKLSLSIGKVYEQQGNLTEAMKEYKNALTTDHNAEAMNRLGRVILLGELQKVGWTGKIDRDKGKDILVHEAEAYFRLVKNKIDKGDKNENKSPKEKNSDNQNQQLDRLKKELYINQGILALSKIELKKLELKEELHKDTRKLLYIAKTHFEEASTIEEGLPTNREGRKARCYLELAKDFEFSKLRYKDLKNFQKELKFLDASLKNLNIRRANGSYCSTIIKYVDNINDANILSEYMGLIDNYKQQLIAFNTDLKNKLTLSLKSKLNNRKKGKNPRIY